MFSKKATKIDEILTVDWALYSTCQRDGEDIFNFCGLLRKHELYLDNILKSLVYMIGSMTKNEAK